MGKSNGSSTAVAEQPWQADEERKIEDFSLRKVFKGASIYGLGETLVKASGFFLIPIYTRVLTPADFGIVGYLQVFSQIARSILPSRVMNTHFYWSIA